MLDVKKKKRRSVRHGRLWLLLIAACMLAVCCLAAVFLQRPAAPVDEDAHITYTELAVHDAAQVQRLAITLRSGESWAAVQTTQGQLSLEDDPAFTVSQSSAQSLLNAVRVISYEDVLSDDPAEFQHRLAEFGLDTPRLVADITYTDGSRWVLRVGDKLYMQDATSYYMTIDGDPRLLAMDKGTVESLMVERALLHPVEQPVLHKARFDDITFADGAGNVLARWTLQGEIGGNAQDRWLLTAPVQYPADGESISNLQANLANIRLGAYAGEATSENLAAFGFDQPRFVLTIHQAAGSIGTTDANGVYGVTDWPEETFTLTVGGAKNDAVDYVRVGEKIYTSSHYALNVLMTMDAIATLSQYTVPVALGNLRQLTVTQQGQTQAYTLTRTERVQENNDLATDSQGNVIYDISCQRDGEMIPYATFESAYNDLLRISVSGNLPAGWVSGAPAHTTFVFEAFTGERYTLELVDFDAMHDAVVLDGHALFYLIKNGMKLNIP